LIKLNHPFQTKPRQNHMKIMFNLVFCAPTPSIGEASFELAESGRGSLDQRSGFGVAGTGLGLEPRWESVRIRISAGNLGSGFRV
jgi:hypothetical protein